jgi:hypothetical protein
MINLPSYIQNSQRTYDLMCRQGRHGVAFNITAATELVEWIDKRMSAIAAEVEPKLPKRPLNKTEEKLWTPPKIQFKKDGTPSAAVLKWFDEVDYKFGMWCAIKRFPDGRFAQSVRLPYHSPIIDSLPMQLKHQGHLKDWFLSLGWKPTMWNLKKDKAGKPIRVDGKAVQTSPKFHEGGRICPNLEKLGDKVDLVKPIIEWMSLRNRRSVLLNEEKGTGWLNHPRLKIDGRLPAASSGLTNTKRQKHKIVANVPRVGSLLGKEMRSLFVASEGMVMVGADASGLEARVKGHYTHKYDNGAYAKKLLDPEYDEHQENAELWGCSRNDAKSPGYALQYNCQPQKFADTLGVPLKIGKEHYEAYWDHNWAVRKAIEETEREFEQNFKKYINTIDGSKVVTRHKHSVFNAKCQSTGAKIMDMAGIIAEALLKDFDIPAWRVIYYHDELQYETYPKYADEVGDVLVIAMERAGEYYNLNVPITGEYKVGTSWASTH